MGITTEWADKQRCGQDVRHRPAFVDISADHKPRGAAGQRGQESPDRELELGVESEPLNPQELMWENVPRKPHSAPGSAIV